jgi:hypothetical protein
MRERDLELIAALAEGRLEDEAEARALIAASDEAAAEFETQSLALRALADASPLEMSEPERAALRRDLWTELRAPAATGRSASTPWYYRWMPVAAGVFVLVGLVAVLSQGGLDGIVSADQAATSETTLAASVTSTAAMSEETGDDASSSDSDGETVTGAPTVTTTVADAGGEAALAPPEAAAFYSEQAVEIRSQPEPTVRSFGDLTAGEVEQCLEEAGYGDYDIRDVDATLEQVEATQGDVPEEAVPYVAATPFGDELATAEMVFVALESCELIHVDR